MATKRIFLDTNIVLDIIQSNRQNHQKALELGQYLVLNDYEILISEDMLTTVFYVSKNKKNTLLFLKEVVMTDWQIVAFGKNVIKEAIELSLQRSLDLEDVLQCLCAKENSCEAIITNDKKFCDCGIKILSIDEFLKPEKLL